jgi:predicted Zn-dependent protease
LDEAEAHLNIALTTLPNQAAYLDTMAEIQFARGRREEALAWSKKSINSMPSDSAIRRQFHRFTHDPLPK